jgi:transcriptional regulator with XRE-family HTH domain
MVTPEAIKALRERRGWSQHQLAEEIGVDQATVSRIENGAKPRGPVEKLLTQMMTAAAKEAAE